MNETVFNRNGHDIWIEQQATPAMVPDLPVPVTLFSAEEIRVDYVAVFDADSGVFEHGLVPVRVTDPEFVADNARRRTDQPTWTLNQRRDRRASRSFFATLPDFRRSGATEPPRNGP